jgi:uncharacterized spore protein YtfJ
MTTLEEIMQGTRDTYTVGRVFGDPVEKDGVTIIPVAAVAGGGGGGSGPMGQAGAEGDDVSADDRAAEGSGGGFGGMAKPAGVYVVQGDSVRWEPAVDVNRLGIAGIALAAVIVIVVGLVVRSFK